MLVVDDFVFATTPLPSVGQMYTAVKGVLTLRQMHRSSSRAAPRISTLGAPGLATLMPALSYARVGVTNAAPTFPSPLTVTLSGPGKAPRR